MTLEEPLDATLRSIDHIANSDVEMQVCSLGDLPEQLPITPQVPLSEQSTVIVLDTNILLEFLDIIQTFTSELEQQGLPIHIIIPGAVIYELDRLVVVCVISFLSNISVFEQSEEPRGSLVVCA